MKRNLTAVPCLLAMLALGCGGQGQNRQDTGGETGAMPGGEPALPADTLGGAMDTVGAGAGMDTLPSADSAVDSALAPQ